MDYTNIIATIKQWDPHTKKLKYCLSIKFDEHNNQFGKGWSPGFDFMNRKIISALPMMKIDLSEYPFIKYDIFKATVSFPPTDTTIGIVAQ